MIKLFVPGRLCLFGEHTDWAGHYRTMNADVPPGMAIVTGIEQGIYAEAEISDVFEMESIAPELENVWNNFSCKMNETALKRVAKSGSFFCYCAGVASYMLEWYNVSGVKITITSMTLPIKSGLSSSAAICVLVARAFNILYHLRLNTLGEMNIAYLGEQRTTSRCGRLDQACAFGVKPNLMTFDGDEIEVKPMNVGKPLYWVFADLCAKKDTIKILSDLNKSYPFPTTERDKTLHHVFGAKNHDVIKRAVKYMSDGDAEALGKLMTETEDVFDKYVAPLSDALGAPKLHRFLSDENIQPLVYGCKGVGSHGDGAVQYIARNAECQQRLVEYLNGQGLHAYSLTIRPMHSVRKAVIPVAGFGTRLFPSTCAVRKDFFPIPCSDGMVRPVILIILEELIDSGIEDVCLILGSKEERKIYRDFFEMKLSDEHLGKLGPNRRKYVSRILEIGKCLHYVYQTEKRGFGHAVAQAEDFADGAPVLLLLGDTIYRSDTGKPCALQLIEEYERYGKAMVAIHPVQREKVSNYGILAGVWEDKDKNILNVTRVKEKPTEPYAEQHLAMHDENGAEVYYSVFGQYILTQDVFDRLDADVRQADLLGKKHDIELTAALDAVRESSGLLGVKLKGNMYDMGNAEAFRKTVEEYAGQTTE